MSSAITIEVDRAASCAFECVQKIKSKHALRHPEDYQYVLSMLYQFLVKDSSDDIHCRMSALRAATDHEASVSQQAFELHYYGKRHPQEKQSAFLVRSIVDRANEHLQEMGALIQYGKLGTGTLSNDAPEQSSLSPSASTLAARRNVIFKN